MATVNIREARDRISLLINAAQAGEEVVITRRGRPVAQLVCVDDKANERLSFPDRRAFRAKFPAAREGAVDVVRSLRDERG